MTNQRIEGFGNRLETIVRTLIPDLVHRHGTPPDKILNIIEVNDIHKAMQIDPIFGRSADTLRNWQLAKKSGSVPRAYIEYLLELYPTLKRDLLELPKIEAFNERMLPLVAARSRWENASKHLLLNRHKLSQLAKRFYNNVDETQNSSFEYQDFPLVAKRNWILRKPKLLTEVTDIAALPELVPVAKPQIPLLEGLDFDAMTLRSSMTLQYRKRKVGRPYFNGTAFRLIDVTAENDNLEFVFGNSEYFDYVNTCEVLALEFADWHLKNPDANPPTTFPLRRSPRDVFNLSGRSAFVGVNCLTILRQWEEPGSITDDHRLRKDVFLIHEREKLLMEAPNCIHVVPAGGHQPLSDDWGDTLATQIWQTAGREFLEEVLNQEELDQHRSDKAGLLERGRAGKLFTMLFRGDAKHPPFAKIYLLGVGIDPITTKPEVLVAIVVDWQGAKSRGRMEENLDFNYEGNGRRIPLSAVQLKTEAKGFVHGRDGSALPTLAAGAACMMIAANHLELLVPTP